MSLMAQTAPVPRIRSRDRLRYGSPRDDFAGHPSAKTALARLPDSFQPVDADDQLHRDAVLREAITMLNAAATEGLKQESRDEGPGDVTAPYHRAHAPETAPVGPTIEELCQSYLVEWRRIKRRRVAEILNRTGG